MIDAEVLAYRLLERDTADVSAVMAELELSPVTFDFTDIMVSADIDVDTLDHLPYVTFTLVGDGEPRNGRGVWGYNLTISVFAEGMDAAKALARVIYAIVWAWDDDPALARITGVGGVASVDSDVDLFSRLGSSVIGARNITQYTGTFGLTLRQ